MGPPFLFDVRKKEAGFPVGEAGRNQTLNPYRQRRPDPQPPLE
jgi:hypothetical protein